MADIVATVDLVPGMVLSEPIVNTFGQILIEGGETINNSHIKMLKTWGIAFIQVKTDGSDDSEEVSEDTIIDAMKRLSKRMNWKPRNKFEQDLMDMGVIASVSKIKDKG